MATVHENAGTRWHVLADPETLGQVVARRVLAAAQAAIAQRGDFRVVLAGGNTPAAIYRLLATADIDWSRWQVYFGDERCLPPEHPERNSVMAARAWLDQVNVPAANIHIIPAELGPEAAARRYAETIMPVLPFDLVLLGMGEDGHTASLFPGQRHDPAALVYPVYHAPKPPAERVSLGLAALNAARQVFVLVTGAGKHAAVRRWRRGEDLPVAYLRGQAAVDVFLDVGADTG